MTLTPVGQQKYRGHIFGLQKGQGTMAEAYHQKVPNFKMDSQAEVNLVYHLGQVAKRWTGSGSSLKQKAK